MVGGLQLLQPIPQVLEQTVKVLGKNNLLRLIASLGFESRFRFHHHSFDSIITVSMH